ncbi:MAG: hypothetical protein R2712_13485 [Vicinamibacterales bacterium]
MAPYTLSLLIWTIPILLVTWFGGAWLWPDPLRHVWYAPLTGLALLMLMAWLLRVPSADPVRLVGLGLLLPALCWLIAYAVLVRRPPGSGQVRRWAELCRDYRTTGAVLLILTAVVPAASFFAWSYGSYLEAYVKERQIALAHAVDGATACARPASGEPMGGEGRRYDAIFYGSRVSCEESGVEGPKPVVHPRFEPYVPYYTSAAVALRELMHDRSDDDAWFSEQPDAALEVSVRAADPGYRLRVTSPLPQLLSAAGVTPGGGNWVAMAALALLAGIGWLAFWVVGYLLRQVLLADVVEPVRPNGEVTTAVGQHVLLVCDDPGARARSLQDAYVLLLTPIASDANPQRAWSRERTAVADVAPVQRVAVPDFDDRGDEPEIMRQKMRIIEELVAQPEQTLIVLTAHRPSVLSSMLREAAATPAEAAAWLALAARFHVVESEPSGAEDAGLAGPAAERAVGSGRLVTRAWMIVRRWWHRRPAGWRAQLMADEGRPNRTLERICRQLQATPAFQTRSLTRDQILEEIEERAGQLYRQRWEECSDDERIVLEHVARHGLASASSRRTVRRLLARGLLRKDPEFRLMNQSFRRFVLGADRRAEVTVLERRADPSLWDRLRVPLGAAALVSMAFLLATQREAFDLTVAMAAGVSGALPVLVRLTTVLTQLGGGKPAGASDVKVNV